MKGTESLKGKSVKQLETLIGKLKKEIERQFCEFGIGGKKTP